MAFPLGGGRSIQLSYRGGVLNARIIAATLHIVLPLLYPDVALLSHKQFRHLVQVITIQAFDITCCKPRREIVIFSRTRCKYIPVRSDAASLRHTVLEKMTIPCLSLHLWNSSA